MITLPTTPWCPTGFTILSDTPIKEFDPKTLTTWLHPKQQEGWINGEDLVKELPSNVGNSTLLKYLLDHPKLIPQEWRHKIIYFWGTILRNPYGYRYVLFLYWNGGEWNWGCNGIDSAFGAHRLSALLASPLETKNELKPLILDKIEELRELVNKLNG